MKKYLIIAMIVLAIFIIGVFFYSRYVNWPKQLAPHAGGPAELNLALDTPATPAGNKQDSLTVEKEGIAVAVAEVKRENNETSIKLVMDNHVYNLGEFDVKSLSSLNGVLASVYQIEGDQVGGHHLEAVLVFPGELAGKLVVGLKPSLLFEFEI